MRTAPHMPPTYHFIDASPLAARYEVIVQAILGFIAAGQFQWVLRYTHKTTRLIRVLGRLERDNHFLQRKLDMLSDIVRCKRVLGELGGLRRLKTWEIAAHRNLNRIETKSATKSASQDYTPPEHIAPEDIEESERLKARVQLCSRACARPNIFRDRVKMDFDGMFCLAPVPSGYKTPRRTIIYTESTIENYVYNPMPFGKETGYGPAPVWPAEFYAALGLPLQSIDFTCQPINLPCHSGARSEPGSSNAEDPNSPKGENLSTFRVPQCGPGMTVIGDGVGGDGDDVVMPHAKDKDLNSTIEPLTCHSGARSEPGSSSVEIPNSPKDENLSTFRVPPCGPGMTGCEAFKRGSIPLLPLRDALSPETYRYLFEDPV